MTKIATDNCAQKPAASVLEILADSLGAIDRRLARTAARLDAMRTRMDGVSCAKDPEPDAPIPDGVLVRARLLADTAHAIIDRIEGTLTELETLA